MVGEQFGEQAEGSGEADRVEAGLPRDPDTARGWSPIIGLAFVIASSALIWSLIVFGVLDWVR